jgi:hypothetical protein
MQIARRHINLPWTKTEPFPSLLPWFFHSLPSCFLRLYLGFFTHYLGPWFCIFNPPFINCSNTSSKFFFRTGALNLESAMKKRNYLMQLLMIGKIIFFQNETIKDEIKGGAEIFS